MFLGKNSKEMLRMMNTKGCDWNKDVPFYLKHGVYAKKIQYLKTCQNPRTNKVLPFLSLYVALLCIQIWLDWKTEEVVRSKVENRSFKVFNDRAWLRVLYCKLWPDSPDVSNHPSVLAKANKGKKRRRKGKEQMPGEPPETKKEAPALSALRADWEKLKLGMGPTRSPKEFLFLEESPAASSEPESGDGSKHMMDSQGHGCE